MMIRRRSLYVELLSKVDPIIKRMGDLEPHRTFAQQKKARQVSDEGGRFSCLNEEISLDNSNIEDVFLEDQPPE